METDHSIETGRPSQTKTDARGRGPSRGRRVASAAVLAIVFAAGGVTAHTWFGSSPATTWTVATSSATSASASDATTAAAGSTETSASGYDPGTEPIVQVVEQVTPSVVTVTSTLTTSMPFGGGASGRAVGTGFVVRADGLIVTNQHVIDGASAVTVTLADGTELAATVLATDDERDLAVLDVDAAGLPALTLGDASDLAVGERVVALGYALELEGGPTVTSGIISSLERTIEVSTNDGTTKTYRDVLQTDAALNAGNSGGPLVTLDGRVVGVDVAGSSGAENIGFAVSVDAARALLDGLASS